MIRIVMSGDVSEVERKTYNEKSLVNFKITDSGLTKRASAWGDLADKVPDSGRILLEGSVKGRAYKNADGADRTSEDITASVIEPLGGGAAVEDDGDLFS